MTEKQSYQRVDTVVNLLKEMTPDELAELAVRLNQSPESTTEALLYHFTMSLPGLLRRITSQYPPTKKTDSPNISSEVVKAQRILRER